MNNLLFKVLGQILENQLILFDTLVDTSQVGAARVTTIELIRKIDDCTGERDAEKSKIDWQKGDIAEIKRDWERAGDHLEVLAPAIFLEQWWVPVDDPEDDEKGPTYHKEASLRKWNRK